MRALEDMDLSTFRAVLDTTFRVAAAGEGPGHLELREAAAAPGDSSGRSWSLVFHADGGLLPQGTWHLRHDVLGELALFLVPVARTEDGYRYQAVFNRLDMPAGGTGQD